MVQKGPNELFLGRRDISPEVVISFHNLQPFFLGLTLVLWKAMVEEDFDGGFFAVDMIDVVRDEADKTTW